MEHLSIEYGNLLKSNITDDVIGSLRNSLERAIVEVRGEGVKITEEDECRIVNNFCCGVDEILEYILAVDLMGYVDNLIVNHDFYKFVEENMAYNNQNKEK